MSTATVRIPHAPGRTLCVYTNPAFRRETPSLVSTYCTLILLTGWAPVFALLAWAARDDR